jgi:hypothetical protein
MPVSLSVDNNTQLGGKVSQDLLALTLYVTEYKLLLFARHNSRENGPLLIVTCDIILPKCEQRSLFEEKVRAHEGHISQRQRETESVGFKTLPVCCGRAFFLYSLFIFH